MSSHKAICTRFVWFEMLASGRSLARHIHSRGAGAPARVECARERLESVSPTLSLWAFCTSIVRFTPCRRTRDRLPRFAVVARWKASPAFIERWWRERLAPRLFIERCRGGRPHKSRPRVAQRLADTDCVLTHPPTPTPQPTSNEDDFVEEDPLPCPLCSGCWQCHGRRLVGRQCLLELCFR